MTDDDEGGGDYPAQLRHVSHGYADHVSILNFIERNCHLPTISNRSRDNLPNPRADEDNPTPR